MADAPVGEAEDLFVRRVVQVNVEPVRHVEHDPSQPRIGSRQLLHLAVRQPDHPVSRQIIRVPDDLRQDLRPDDVGRHDPGRVEENRVDGGAKLRALMLRAILADDDPRRESRLAGAIQDQPFGSDVDPDAVRRQWPRQPALAFKVHHDRAQKLGRGGLACRGARAVLPQGLAQRPVGGRRRRQRLDHRRRISAVGRGIEHRRHIDRPRRQDLVIAPLPQRYGAAGQRVGIGQERVRQDQLAVERRQCRSAPQQAGMKPRGVEPLVAGAQHRIHQ